MRVQDHCMGAFGVDSWSAVRGLDNNTLLNGLEWLHIKVNHMHEEVGEVKAKKGGK